MHRVLPLGQETAACGKRHRDWVAPWGGSVTLLTGGDSQEKPICPSLWLWTPERMVPQRLDSPTAPTLRAWERLAPSCQSEEVLTTRRATLQETMQQSCVSDGQEAC